MNSVRGYIKRIKDSIYSVLVWSSAADRTILDLEECKQAEQIKHSAIGALLFVTAGVAGIAGGYMFYLILQVQFLASILGILWGMIFFFIDRSVVASVRKRENKTWKDISLASPRVFLACLAAIFVSYGMDLKYFESDITLEMSDHSDSLISSYIGKNNVFIKENFDDGIGALKLEVTEGKKTLPIDLQIIVDDFKEAEKQVDSLSIVIPANNARLYQQINYIKARYLPDSKISLTDNQRLRSLLNIIGTNNSILRTAKVHLDTLDNRKVRRMAVYQTSIDSLEKRNSKQIAKIEEKRDTISRYFDMAAVEKEKLHKDNTKLSARIASLDRITSFKKNYTNWKLYWQLFLLFFAIELIPVLTKLFMWRGPYDFILEAKELEVEFQTRTKRSFYASPEFDNLNSFEAKHNTETRSKFQRVRSRYKTTNDFLLNNEDEHTRFVKYIQKRIISISKLDGEMNGILKEHELKNLENTLKIFYKQSDKANEEFNNEK